MNKIVTFFRTHKYAFIWTACYICMTWAILYFMFNFSIFSAPQWRHLMRAELHGFAGFVFGILVLAALPLYVATTTLVIRTKKPLITIPIPKIKIPKLIKPTPAPATTPAPVTKAESETPSLGPDEIDAPTEMPKDMPAELRHAFIRARNNVGRLQTSSFNSVTSPIPQPELASKQISDAFPLPTDFDLDESDNTPNDIAIPEFSTMPTFTEINFDDNINDDTPTEDSGRSESPPDNTCDNSTLIEYLTQNNRKFSIDGNIVITDTRAIITHSDDDFWVADTENWFAAGRVQPSPIIAVQDTAHKHNCTPVIYLESTNIMDIEKLKLEWESSGITVITDLSEL